MRSRDAVQAAAPALIYTLLTNLVYALLASSGLVRSDIMRQAVSVAVCLILAVWHAKRQRVSFCSHKTAIYRYPAAFCYAMAVVMCGIANNYIFTVILTRFQDISPGYAHVTEIFYNNSLAVEIVTLCILAPLAEEIGRAHV